MSLGVQLSDKNGIVYFKNTKLSKKEKKQAKEGIVQKLNDIGKTYKPDTLPADEVREWFQVCPKIEGKRIPIKVSWHPGELKIELFGKFTPMLIAHPQHKNKGWAILTVGENQYPLSGQGVMEVFKSPIRKITSSGLHCEHVCLGSEFVQRDEFWDGGKWKVGFYKGGSSETGLEYRDRIYPVFNEFVQILPENSKILEVCAGDGELAEQVFIKFPSKVNQYHLLDLNKPSLKKAEDRLGHQIQQGKAFLHHVNVAETEFLDLTQNERVDCILGSGALTVEVLPTRETALKVLDQIAKVLKPKGMVMLAGFQKHWVHAKDLEERGFTVMSKFCVFQLYVARKN